MKKICCVLLLSLLIVIGIGCGQKTQESKGNTQTSVGTNEITEKDTTKTEKIEVYFTDTQVEKLEQEEYELSFNNDNEIFEALQENTNPEKISLWNKIELISVSFNEDTVTIDIHIPDDARLGSGPEQLALEVLKRTYFQFDEVKNIELLVDGKRLDSLMGHTELEQPIQRDQP
ncbi:GerMN domain-containing protein [Paenibacillus sp. OAE614]|uniref:GerMN domain-containing protein n=1 Tax=Paenibacillus sp. OAE614 TaxID=2663804 RepID=UPI003398BBFC